MRNDRAPSSVLLVSIWNDINVIKNYIYVILDDMDAIIFFFCYIYVIPDGHQKNTRRSSSIPQGIYVVMGNLGGQARVSNTFLICLLIFCLAGQIKWVAPQFQSFKRIF